LKKNQQFVFTLGTFQVCVLAGYFELVPAFRAFETTSLFIHLTHPLSQKTREFQKKPVPPEGVYLKRVFLFRSEPEN